MWWEENIVKENTWILKVLFPAWSYKPSVDPRWWAWFIYNFWESHKSLKLSYDIMFDKDFDFVKWWKLPWLCWWTCSRWWMGVEQWFSVRFSWKQDWYLDALSNLPWLDKFWVYTWKEIFKFTPWENYNISQEIVLNDVWKSNGTLKVYVNSELMYEKSDIIYRKSYDVNIDWLLFSTFFWWNDDSWATPKDTFIIFKNFKIEI